MAQRARESIVVNAPLDVVYHVVTDFSNYLTWVSDLKNITILERDSTDRPIEIEFRAAAFGRSTTYALRYDYTLAPVQLQWTQTSGDLTQSLHGQYHFEPSDAGTKVTYDLEVELLVPIPTFVRTRAAQRIQTQALRELKVQAESQV